MSSSAISKRYARALVELAAADGTLDQVGKDLDRVLEVFKEHSQLRLLLESPTLDLQKKRGMLADLTQLLDVSTRVANFLGVLLENDRLVHLSQVRREFQHQADEHLGILRGKVTAAQRLTKAQIEGIKEALQERTNKQIELNVNVDHALIGGLKTQIGDKVFDASLKTQLQRMQDTLKKG